ncbi:MAG: hypothetical protein HS132_18780 [Planctomycetia bacterium]|nr:hypothetical protein [Planctomycetia bacterium]
MKREANGLVWWTKLKREPESVMGEGEENGGLRVDRQSIEAYEKETEKESCGIRRYSERGATGQNPSRGCGYRR